MDSIITEYKVVSFQSERNMAMIRYYAYILSGTHKNRVVLCRNVISSLSMIQYLKMRETIYIHSASSIYLSRIK